MKAKNQKYKHQNYSKPKKMNNDLFLKYRKQFEKLKVIFQQQKKSAIFCSDSIPIRKSSSVDNHKLIADLKNSPKTNTNKQIIRKTYKHIRPLIGYSLKQKHDKNMDKLQQIMKSRSCIKKTKEQQKIQSANRLINIHKEICIEVSNKQMRNSVSLKKYEKKNMHKINYSHKRLKIQQPSIIVNVSQISQYKKAKEFPQKSNTIQLASQQQNKRQFFSMPKQQINQLDSLIKQSKVNQYKHTKFYNNKQNLQDKLKTEANQTKISPWKYFANTSLFNQRMH